MGYRRIAGISEVPVNTMKIIDLDGTAILLSNIDGAFYAIDNKCTHFGGSLGKGKLGGNTVTCPRHGAQFDVRTGEAVGEAKIGFIKMKVREEQKYTVRVEGEDILVDIP